MIMRTNPGPPQAQNPRTQKVGLLENADVGGESTQEIKNYQTLDRRVHPPYIPGYYFDSRHC